MKPKILTLLLPALLLGQIAIAQRNPSQEILIFFKEGIARKSQTINDKTLSHPHIYSDGLKTALTKLGIDETILEVANPKFNEKDTLMILMDGTVLRQMNMTNLYRFRVPEGKSKKELIDALNKLPEVLYAELNGKVKPLLIPSDVRFDEQWSLVNTVVPGADIHADPAWDIFTGNPNNIIAIIDGGTDNGHEDLNAKINGGDNGFGWAGHGIHVSGIAAAESNNGQGVSGVDWQAQIHAQRIDIAEDDVDTYNAIIDAVNFSPNVHVLNSSWGLVFEDETPGRNSITVRQAFAYAYKANRTSVVAMGNHQVTNPNITAFPAGFENVIAVGATNIFDQVANFSAHGNHIDVSAPGVNILSTLTGGGYANQSGTSMATPHVSGIASLLKGFRTDLANNDIENIIRFSADDLNNPGAGDGTDGGFDPSSGMGRVNAERALNFLRPPFNLNQWSVKSGTISNSTGNLLYQFYGTGSLASGNYIVKRHEVRKTVTFPTEFCQIIGAWGRGVSTTGWNRGNPNYGEGFCEIVPGTLTNNVATLQTYIYEVVNILGQTLGWYPTTPANVTFAYSVLGIPGPNTNITGDFPPESCTSSTQIFTLSNPAGGIAQTWSVSNGLQIVGSNTGTSVTIRVTGNGNQWIQAAITNMCNTQTNVSKTVSVGIPQLSVSTYDDRTPQPSNYTYHTATAVQVPGTVPSDYRWFQEVNGVPTTQIASGLQLNQWPIPPCSSRFYQLQVTTDCGMAVYRGYTYNYYGCGSMYTVYPNPAAESLTVERVDGDDLAEPDALSFIQNHQLNNDADTEYILHNQFGKKVLYVKSKSPKTDLDIKSIPEGIYLLRIIMGSNSDLQRIVIAR